MDILMCKKVTFNKSIIVYIILQDMLKKLFDKSGLLLFVKNNSDVKLEDLLNSSDYLINDKTLPRDLRIIEDARSSKVKFSFTDLNILIEKTHEVSIQYTRIRHAVIHDSPKNTALALLFQRKNTSKNYYLGVFSTEEAALNWLAS